MGYVNRVVVPGLILAPIFAVLIVVSMMLATATWVRIHLTRV